MRRLLLVLVAAVAMLTTAIGCGGGGDAVITDGPTPTAPEKVPYDPASLLRRPIGNSPALTDRSAAIIDRLVENTRAARVGIATDIETPPIYRVKPSDPFLSLKIDGRTLRFRVPEHATPGGGTDHPIVLLDPNHPELGRDIELRMFQAVIDRDAGTLTASGVGVGHYNNDGARLNPDKSRSVGVPFLGQGTGSGLSIMAGLIRPEEVEAGRIRHAVRFAYSSVDSTNTFRPPAVKTDQPKDGYTRDPASAMEMGMRLQLDPEVDCSRRTVPGKSSGSRETRFLRILCRALQEYGMVMLDGTGEAGVLLEMEGSATGRWDQVIGETGPGGYGYIVRADGGLSDGLNRNEHSGIPWDRMRVLALDG